MSKNLSAKYYQDRKCKLAKKDEKQKLVENRKEFYGMGKRLYYNFKVF